MLEEEAIGVGSEGGGRGRRAGGWAARAAVADAGRGGDGMGRGCSMRSAERQRTAHRVGDVPDERARGQRRRGSSAWLGF